VTLHWGIVEGRMECVGLALVSPDEPSEKSMAGPTPASGARTRPLLTTVLRRFPFGELVDRQRQQAYRELREALAVDASGYEPIPGLEHVPFFSTERRAARETTIRRMRLREPLAAYEAAEKGRGGRPSYPPQHFEQVATVYAEAHAAGKPPTKAVAMRFGITRSAAAKQVSRARDLGFLGETNPGRAGGVVRRRKGDRR
jgi:hypothetical protein